MRLLTTGATCLFLVLLFVEPALAAEGESTLRQLFVLGFPLILFVGLWLFFIRKMTGGRQRELIERSFVHMERLEEKMDRLIELQERNSRGE